MSKEKWFTVKAVMEVTRSVQASSEEEAIEKADTQDMVHELKNYNPDVEFSAEAWED